MLNTQLNLNKLNTISRSNILSSGFTLIELLVVIVILAILAVAVIVAINPAATIGKTNNAKTLSDIAGLGSSAGQYAAQYAGYPQATGFGQSGGTTLVTWKPTTAPLDGTGAPYVYVGGDSAGAACTTNCVNMALSGIVDGADTSSFRVPAGTAILSNSTKAAPYYFCYRSASGTITLSQSAATNGTYVVGSVGAGGVLTGNPNCTP